MNINLIEHKPLLSKSLKIITDSCHQMAGKFTYQYYNQRIKEEILGWR